MDETNYSMDNKTHFDTMNHDFQDCAKNNTSLFYEGQKVPGFHDAVYLEQLSGEGGFASVHKIYDRKEDKYYAMKIPKNELVKVPEICQVFMEEAKILAELPGHPNIIKPVHFVKWNNIPCFFTEFVNGKTLDKLVKFDVSNKRTAFTLTFMLSLFIEICRGLNFAWQSKGLVHLDLKPQNILWDEADGHLKIIDFGLSRFISQSYKRVYKFGEDIYSDAKEAEKTVVTGFKQKRAVVGTFPFMSPEHFKGIEYCDTRSDIYSTGIIMYEIAAGHRPFDARDINEYEKLHTEKKIDNVPNAGGVLKDIILKCLEKEAANRFQTFNDLLNSLEKEYTELTGLAYPSEGNEDSISTEFLNKAHMLYSFRSFDKCLDIIEKALELEPDSIELLTVKAQALYSMSLFQKSREIAENILVKEPGNIEALFLKAHIHHAAEEYEEAIECFETLKKMFPEDTSYTCSYLAQCYMECERMIEAEFCVDEGWRDDPDNPEIISARAHLYIKKEQHQKAEELTSPYLKTDWDGRYHNLYAWVLSSIGKNEKAIELLKEYLKENPDNHLIWFRLGDCYNCLGQNEPAIQAFEKAIEIQPDNASYVLAVLSPLTNNDDREKIMEYANNWKDKAMVNFDLCRSFVEALLFEKSLEKALCFNGKALEIKPECVETASDHVWYLTQANRAFEAVSFGLDWEQNYESDRNFVSCMSYALRKTGQYEKSLQYYWKKLSTTPANHVVSNCEEGFIDTFIKVYGNEENTPFAKRVIEKFNLNPNCLRLLGDVFNDMEKADEALTCYKTAVENGWDNPEYALKVLKILYENGSIDEALSFADYFIQKYNIDAYAINGIGKFFFSNKAYFAAEKFSNICSELLNCFT